MNRRKPLFSTPFRLFAAQASAALLILLAAACQNPVGGSDSGTVAVSGVVLAPAAAELDVGQTLQLTATVSPADAADKRVIWTSGNEAVAEVGISGLVTALSAGSATITATTADGNLTDSCVVEVSGEALAPPSGLSYSTVSCVYVVGAPISANGPAVVGVVSAYAISPPLPPGLSLDPGTGIISGTPSSAAASAEYTVTASNASGSTWTRITILVQEPAAEVVHTYAEVASAAAALANAILAAGATADAGAAAYHETETTATEAIVTFRFNGYADGGYAVSGALVSTTDLATSATKMNGSVALTGGDVAGIECADVVVSGGAAGGFYVYAFADGSSWFYDLSASRFSSNGSPASWFSCGPDGDSVRIDGLSAAWEASADAAKNAVSIPTLIGGKTVKSIGSNAFSDRDTLVSVVVPDSVATLGGYVFSDCDSLVSVSIGNAVVSVPFNGFASCGQLASVTLGASVGSIGDYAFRDCPKLAGIELPASLSVIGGSAFNRSGLASASIPASVTLIGDRAFALCMDLASITVAAGNSTYASVDGVLFSADMKKIRQYPAAKAGSAYSIPAGVETIGDSAFSGALNPVSVAIPDSVSAIDDAAFSACRNLASVEIPSSVTVLGGSAFFGCPNLGSAEILSQSIAIGNAAFFYCELLASVTMRADVPPTIGSGVFEQNAAGRVIRVPAAALGAYGAAAGWSGYSAAIAGY